LRKDKIGKEQSISSEMKPDILTNTVDEVMHKINGKEEFDVQRPHIPLVPEKTRTNVPKHFASSAFVS
jgi:hypothetical protein